MSDTITINTEYEAFGRPATEIKCSGYGLRDLVKDKESIVGLEIGCDIGDTSHFMLSSLPQLTLHVVDPYMTYVDWNGRNLDNRNEVFDTAMQRLLPFGDRFNFYKKTSDEAVGLLNDNYFDYIFIDGLHTYEQLTIDCANYYSKVKDGGIFAGHDFTVIPGVNKAVKEFAAKMGKEILTTECDVWYWVK